MEFCRREGILVQGRGSAANSAVCYSLGITAVDPVGMDLLFERFLTEERDEWPDIDLDLPSGDQRERVIQYVYKLYGQHGAAMTANVITYRGRSAAREVGKVLGFDEASLARLSSLVRAWEWKDPQDTHERRFQEAGFDLRTPKIRKFLDLYLAIQDLPRHLGQHSGGMVDVPGTTGFGGAAGTRYDAGASRRAVGQGRLRGPENHQGGFTRAGHDGRARRITGAYPRFVW